MVVVVEVWKRWIEQQDYRSDRNQDDQIEASFVLEPARNAEAQQQESIVACHTGGKVGRGGVKTTRER